MGNKRDYYHGAGVKARGNYYRHNGTAYVDIELIAGMFKVVADNTARDAIAAEKRSEGLVVYITSTKVKYQLIGGIANANWVAMNLVEVFADSGVAVPLIIGDITREKGVILTYVMERGALSEMGVIKVTSKDDTKTSRSDDFDFCGILFEKEISGNNIVLNWTDDLKDGEDTNFWCSVERIMF